MKPRVSDTKNKRVIRTFEPEPDVAAMLEKAQCAGLTMGEILNTAMRDCGKRVIKNLALKRADRLTSLSFNEPQLQLAGVN